MNTITKKTFGISLVAAFAIAALFVLALPAYAADLPVIPGGGETIDSWIPMGGDIGGGDLGMGGFGGGMGGFSSPGFFGGGGFTSGFGGFSGMPSNTNVNTNTNTLTQVSTCTAVNSCNVDDHSIFNAPTTVTIAGGGSNGGSYPVYVPVSQPVYAPQQPIYTQQYQYPAQYPVYQQPTVYRAQPYVSLAAAPYTGLDLGTWGTAAYWGFLVLWCLIAAYLVAVKKIQNKIVAWMVGSTPTRATVTHAPVRQAATSTPSKYAGIDPFIASQISRAK